MQLTHEIIHLREQCESLLSQVFHGEKTISEFRAWEKGANDAVCVYAPPPQDAYSIHLGDRWDSTDGYLYLQTELTLPQPKAGHKVFGNFDFSSIHEGYGHGFEAMLYVDGQPWHGVDDNHMLVTLDAWAGKTVELELLLWSGTTGKSPAQKTHIVRTAEIGWLDDELEDAATLFDMTLSVADTLAETDETRLALLELARRMSGSLIWDQGRETLRASAINGGERLIAGLSQLPKPSIDCIIHCVGHTHIDYAWLWRIKHTREKIARSFSTVLRLMEEFPEYRFFQSSPEYYCHLEQDHPAISEQVNRAISDGRWEAGGGMWVESDCNMISGESMIRQILYAKRFYQSKFGISDKAVWLPDTFGFGWTMPQILKKCGIEVFFTSKLSWNQSSRFPNDTFWWQGPDGSRVLASLLTVPANGFPPQPWATTYNGEISPDTLLQTWELYQNKGVSQDLLYLYGYGDGGGGSTRTMIKRLRAIKEIPFPIDIRFDTAKGFFGNIRSKAKEGDMPVWDGELYLECHRGTYTSQAFAKRENRRLERRLANTEFFQVLRDLRSGKSASFHLEDQWRILLRNQFHDILPGSSVHQVYEDLRREFAALHTALDRIDQECLSLNEKSEGFSAWNTSGWVRNALVELPASEPTRWQDETGRLLESVYLGKDRHLVFFNGIKPFSAACAIPTLHGAMGDERAQLSQIDLVKRTLETPRFAMQWAENGQLTRVFSKMEGFELFENGENGNQLIVFEDKPAMFDAWDIDANYVDRFELVENLVQVSVEENNLLRTVLRFEFRFGASTLTQDMVFSRDDDTILFVHHVDWHEHQRLLRAEFPLNIVSQQAVFDIPFGNITRPTTQTTVYEKARFEVPAHRWVDLSQRDRGVSLLNDCKYGHSAKGNRLGISLIKSAIDPDEEADQGAHTYTYALYPHAGDWSCAGTHQRAAELNNPQVIVHGVDRSLPMSLFRTTGAQVEIDAVKRSESGAFVVLRLHEYAGKPGKVQMIGDFNITRYCECNLLETQQGEWIEDGWISAKITPYEIKTFLIQMN